MRQRIAIAIALACGPRLLIADEPTTALDVTVQAGILRLLDRLRREHDLSVILITHDLAVMSSLADRVSIFYAGRVVESGPRPDVLQHPRHPYTRALLDALPHPEAAARHAAGGDQRAAATPQHDPVRLPLPPTLRLRRRVCSDGRSAIGAGERPPARLSRGPVPTTSRARAARRRGGLRAAGPRASASRRGREPDPRAGTDPRPRRRVGLRQVEPRPRGGWARSPRRRQRPLRGP